MKTNPSIIRCSITLLALCLMFISAGAQIPFLYLDNNTLLRTGAPSNQSAGRGESPEVLAEGKEVLRSDLSQPTQYVHTSQLPEYAQVSADMYLHAGLMLPSGDIVHVEQDLYMTGHFNFYLSSADGSRQLVFSDADDVVPDHFVPAPFDYISDRKVLFEMMNIEELNDHAGVYTYDLETGVLDRLPITKHYISTPILSPDKSQLIYGAMDDRYFDGYDHFVHGSATSIDGFHLGTWQEKVMVRGEHLIPLGWSKKQEKLHLVNPGQDPSTTPLAARAEAITFRLPFEKGNGRCVTRSGTPAPTGSPGSSSTCGFSFNDSGRHGYPAVDFEIPSNIFSNPTPIVAAAAGIVIQTAYVGAYGYLVRIRHDDNSVTYYAHLREGTFAVRVGDRVESGCVVGIGGSTGRSTGPHLHLERRIGVSSVYAPIYECGNCIPQKNYRYTSQNACGPEEVRDLELPTTQLTANGSVQTGDFAVTFTDNDNVGVTRRFYQVLEKYGDNWYANRGNGFFNDNFNVFYGGYTAGAGIWSISEGHLLQSDLASDNTKLSSFVSQASGLPYLYEFSAKMISTTGPRKFGIHIMADDATQSQRGNSYLIWFAGDNKVRVYKTIANQLSLSATEDVTLDNDWAKYRVTYSPGYGVLQVFKNNELLLKWIDPEPIKSGSSISLRTNQTQVEFDDLKVYKFRSTSIVTVTAGSAVTNDARRASADGSASCKVKSMVRDDSGNWSIPGNLDIALSFANARLTASTNDDPQPDLNVYPNPTDGPLKLDYLATSLSPVHLMLSDGAGKVWSRETVTPTQVGWQSVSLEDFLGHVASGAYFLQVEREGVVSTLRLLRR
ncbi:MAG: peptidoglycan DD-metalloendopeptidase family protein [Bacteroidota bacterium]